MRKVVSPPLLTETDIIIQTRTFLHQFTSSVLRLIPSPPVRSSLLIRRIVSSVVRCKCSAEGGQATAARCSYFTLPTTPHRIIQYNAVYDNILIYYGRKVADDDAKIRLRHLPETTAPNAAGCGRLRVVCVFISCSVLWAPLAPSMVGLAARRQRKLSRSVQRSTES